MTVGFHFAAGHGVDADLLPLLDVCRDLYAAAAISGHAEADMAAVVHAFGEPTH
ncbi:hypothetical protein [Paractinoplanes hotanensis]|uniref:Uncharacterized protein n=1 Tax=Paractinoplanes hotanensis TaxID=2906497 RepID=A0ABT0XXA0_9ACTN|nr:hypothetical protein [Actinoplanes hotanensis]MCM4077734.1 hypothetical protein [Actinoplanes hotanensis]